MQEDENHEENITRHRSYYSQEELIFLGPDENMTNDLITWGTSHAQKRGYKYADAFISSKPDTGINHKEYGVTSQGLHVFLGHLLSFLNIDVDKEGFTVKMTGGPDGDVAGNELKLLHETYGEKARVVAIADGLGAAYDPDGLDWRELLRLVNESKSIAFFQPEKLSGAKESFVITANTSENIARRNNLHFETNTDIFIPAGGRPYSVNEKNWEGLLNSDKSPNCKGVVEGANIFFSQSARDELQSKGILFIKDSSANKTGVICSSYEVIASLILSKEDYLGIKDNYIQEVLEILQEKANKEASLLFSSFQESKSSETLVSLSQRISREINDLTDILLDRLIVDQDKVLQDPLFQRIISHCPAVLERNFPGKILQNLPASHKIAIIASHVASYIVYSEGLNWLNSQERAQIKSFKQLYPTFVTLRTRNHLLLSSTNPIFRTELL